MFNKVVYSSILPIKSSDIKELTLISLEDWVLVSIAGVDNVRYLQDQFTCDLFSLKNNKYSFSAHCNSKGKTIGFMIVFYYKNCISYIIRRNILNIHLQELKKYSCFYKIEIIVDNDINLLGIVGFQKEKQLRDLFEDSFNKENFILNKDNLTIIFFKNPIPRAIVISNDNKISDLKVKLNKKAKFINSQQWLSLDIESGFPIIDEINSGKFIPQYFNIHNLNGISFNKGCYIGQEIIIRSQYHKNNKFAMFWLIGKFNGLTPCIGEKLECKINDQWYIIGNILAISNMQNGSIWIQAILNKRITYNDNLFRVHKNKNFFIKLIK